MSTKKFASLIAALGLVIAMVLGAGGPATAAPVAKKQTVTIIAKMNGKATVTYSGNGVISQKDRTGTWSRTFAKEPYTYYSLTVSAFEGATSVGCIIKVNGKTVKNKTASGDSFASVSCAYTSH